MKKRFMNVMAIMVALGMVFMAGPVLAADDIPAPHAGVLGGTVPFCADWTISTDGAAAALFGTTDAADYIADELTLTNFIACTDFNANSKVKVSAKKGNWTVPDDYNTTTGAKKEDGSDSDLLIAVTVDTAGLPESGMALSGDFGATYKALTTSDQQILQAGAVGENVGYGIEGAAFSVDSKVLMDWKYDIVGTYGVTVTLTIEEMTS